MIDLTDEELQYKINECWIARGPDDIHPDLIKYLTERSRRVREAATRVTNHWYFNNSRFHRRTTT